MSRKQWIVLSAVLVAAAFVVWLALSSRQPPLLPADEAHAAFENAATCLGCHGAGGPAPQSPRHPLGDDCLRCHGKR
jgi:cytochrome c553